MDVMRPKLIWANGVCYRVNHSQISNGDEDPNDFIRGDDADCEEEEMISPAEIEEWNGKFRVLLDIPSALYGSIIGRRGNSLHQVQDNTGCRVTVPRGAKSKVSEVEVVGEQRRGVVRACNMLTMAAERGRQRLAPSHFVAVRLATQHVQNRLETFKVEALRVGGGSRGVAPALFQDGCRLHLTLALLTLLSEPERRRLCQTLQQHADQLRSLLAPSGLSLRVRGLDIMNDDPGETRVVFARVQDADGGDGMQRLADRCRELALSTGLGKNEDYDRVKLHCTLMNVSFLVRHVDESDPEYAKLRKATFDARAILEELGHFDFGTVRVDSLEVVQRHSTGEDGFYLPIGAIKLTAG